MRLMQFSGLGMLVVVVAMASFAVFAEPVEPVKCAAPVLTVVVIDDRVNETPWAAETARQFKLSLPAGQLRQELLRSGCVTILDSDPVFASIAATAQPDAVLRVRHAELKASEKSLGAKAGSAVGRYLGSYLGSSGDEVLVLQSMELSAELLCARSRRMVRQFTAQAVGVATAKAEDNPALQNEASAKAAREILQFLQARPVACAPPGPSPRIDLPATPTLTP